jgi:hypothetical protein
MATVKKNALYRDLYRFKEQNLEYTQWVEKNASNFVRLYLPELLGFLND